MKAARWGRLAWPVAFIALWCALRVFWIDADAGVPSIWEYGYNVTDEGYYMGAAKDKYLWGTFCDLDLGESFTYGYSAMTHWLAYIGYAALGLTDWGWRVPFYVLYLLAWCMTFEHVRKRTGDAVAFAGCAMFSSLPLVIAYERTACNDLTIGALAVIAFCLASGKGTWRIFASAVVIGAVILVKPSVWVLLPFVAAGVLSERKTRAAWLDLALFVVASLAAICLWKLLAILSVLPEASRHGVSAAEIIRRTTTHNALPSLLDISHLCRGFSSFPRDICLKSMSVTAIFLSLVPLAMAAYDLLRRKPGWRTLLYLSVPAYVAAVSTNNSICLHYYHPALMALPILLAEAKLDLDQEQANAVERQGSGKTPVALLALLTAMAGCVSFFALSATVKPQEVVPYVSNISNLPQKVVWGYNAAFILASAALATTGLSFMRGLAALKREGFAWFLLAAAGSSVAFAGLPGLHLAPYMKQTQDLWFAPMALSMMASFAFLAIVFGLPATGLRRRAFMCFIPTAIALSFVFVPTWRNAIPELLGDKSRQQREAAAEIAGMVPTNSVVIGERSRQMLMGHPIRTATTMPACDPIPTVETVLRKDPSVNLFALADSQNAYNLQHFREHSKEYRLDLLKEYKLPSFATGRPASVYFCRIVPIGPRKAAVSKP